MSYVDIIMFQDFFWNLIKKESIVWNERIWIWNWNGRMHVVGGGRWACINIWLIGNQRILESWILWAAAPTHWISVLIQIFKKKPCLLSWVKVLRPRVIRLFVCFIVLVFVQLESLFGQKPKLWGFSKIEVELLKCKTFCGKLLSYGHFVMVRLLTDNMCVFKLE